MWRRNEVNRGDFCHDLIWQAEYVPCRGREEDRQEGEQSASLFGRGNLLFCTQVPNPGAWLDRFENSVYHFTINTQEFLYQRLRVLLVAWWSRMACKSTSRLHSKCFGGGRKTRDMFSVGGMRRISWLGYPVEASGTSGHYTHQPPSSLPPSAPSLKRGNERGVPEVAWRPCRVALC